MGGHGSGRSTSSLVTTTSDRRWLDVMRLSRGGYLRAGLGFSVGWSRDGQLVASIGITVLADDALKFTYTLPPPPPGAERQAVQERVEIEWAPCRFGGSRPWFLCPGAGCGRRVARLYQGPRYFLCRHCLSLAYESQREGDGNRALRRAQRIRRRLGGSGSMAEPFPNKPPRMRWETYSRLRGQAEGHEARYTAWLEGWLAGVDRFIAVRQREVDMRRPGDQR